MVDTSTFTGAKRNKAPVTSITILLAICFSSFSLQVWSQTAPAVPAITTAATSTPPAATTPAPAATNKMPGSVPLASSKTSAPALVASGKTSAAASVGSNNKTAAAASTGKASAASNINLLTNSSGPSWSELTAVQQQALAPLVTEWKNFGPARKSKWLQIANKYASMSTEEQQRLQDKMRDWVKMSPEERRVARQNYTNSKKITQVEKTEKWQQYQQLPEEQKKKLAADSTVKKQVTNLPAPGSAKQGKVGPPLKSITRPANGSASSSSGISASSSSVSSPVSSASSKANAAAKPLPGSPASAVPAAPVAAAAITPAPAAVTPTSTPAAPATTLPATPIAQPSPVK